MRLPTNEELKRIGGNVAKYVFQGEELEAILPFVERCFVVPEPKETGAPLIATTRKLAKKLAEIASDVTGSSNGACETVEENPDSETRTTATTLWRYFDDESPRKFMMKWRLFWYLIFHIARTKFGLLRYGYEVYIDETQALFFGDAPEFGHEAEAAKQKDCRHTQASLLSGPAKDDKYSGKFRAHTYQVMMACLRGSRILLPLDVILVATKGDEMPPELQVQTRSKSGIIGHFVGLLQALYPPPRLIMFDRGYESNEGFAKLTIYCRRFGIWYLTPAVKSKTRARDEEGEDSVRNFVKSRKSAAVPICKGSSITYVVGKAPIPFNRRKGEKSVRLARTLIVFYRPKTKKKVAEGAVEFEDRTWGFAFYTNHPRPQDRITWWEAVYSGRWREEHAFAQKARFNSGFNHLITRRMAIYYTGFLCFALFMLRRGVKFPRYDGKKISRQFSFPKYQRRLLNAIANDTRGQSPE